MRFHSCYASPIGMIHLQSDGANLKFCQFCDQDCSACHIQADPVQPDPDPVLTDAITWLSQYFSQQNPLPFQLLDPDGTPFQKKVWSAASQIISGSTRTYGAIAHDCIADRPGSKMSAQAVGQALAKNPLCIFIPCHRVTAAKGRLGGYAWKTERKEWLLAFEKEAIG